MRFVGRGVTPRQGFWQGRIMTRWTVALDHTIPKLLAHAAETHGDTPFIVGEDGTRLSFVETKAKAEQLARGLIALGVAQGDRVAIWAPNGSGWILAALATETIGAIMVPINTRFKRAEAVYILAKAGVRVLFTTGDFLGTDYVAMLRGDQAEESRIADLPALDEIVLLDGEAPREGARSWANLIDVGKIVETLDARMAAVTPETVCDILFTSGTTGHPKGAMHAHGQALWMPTIWNGSNDLQAGDRALIVNPFFHSFGYRSGWISALIAGMTVYPVAAFDAEAALKRIQDERITVLMGAPTLFTSLIEHPKFADYDISSLRVGHTGSAGMSVETIKRVKEELGYDLLLTSYGLTEATALVSVNYPDADFETIARTVGYKLPGTELRIVDPEGKDQPADGSGELLVRGPNVMQGYFEDPEATARAIDADGWLHTGDVAAISQDGKLRILDRLKDIVLVGGFNVYPAEVEHTLLQHPAIAEAAVIAVPDERMGEVPGACVVLRTGASLSMAELTPWARERLANFKVPRHLFVEEAFPRTPLGKVQKFLLRDRALARLG